MKKSAYEMQISDWSSDVFPSVRYAYWATGAIVAALTTSIPEAADTPRTWDYRYCWMRDAYFVVQALNRLGATKTMEDFLRYINTVVAQHPGESLQPLYGIIPGSPLEERSLENMRLEGHSVGQESVRKCRCRGWRDE